MSVSGAYCVYFFLHGSFDVFTEQRYASHGEHKPAIHDKNVNTDGIDLQTAYCDKVLPAAFLKI